ncbi:MAG: transcription antitermination factor NusB [Actinomycetota bacterium]
MPNDKVGASARRPRPRRDDERSDARERALTILYEAHSKRIAPSEALGALVIGPDVFTSRLVLGVEAESERFDALIREHSKNWSLERMPVLDVTILRIALFELSSEADTPTAVIINEAVELAKRFSTDDSGKFVNGMLSAIAPQLRA